MRISYLVITGLFCGISLVAQPIRINAGGAAYTDSQGVTWSADTGYSAGLSWSTSQAVSGTSSSALYQTCRYGEFDYQFSVPDGNYTVNLKFAEVSQNAAGRRVFNVSINNSPVLTNFDVLAQAGGALKAIDKSFPVTVGGGQIAIQFRNGPANSPLINAIEIVPTTGGSSSPTSGSVRVNAGGGAFTDPQGQAWTADAGFAGGFSWNTVSPIANTSAQALYQTCRYGEFDYKFSLANGFYTVSLKFAEVSQNAAGRRVFNVNVNSAPALTNFDIFAQAGGQNIAVDKSFLVNVTGGQVVIQFRNGSANSPLVNAIEIVPAGTASTPPPAASSPVRVNSGGSAITDSLGQAWTADAGFSGGAAWSTTHAIGNTSAQTLYQTCRYGAFAYQFSVPNGNYTVNLKFAEVSQTAAGKRVFNVSINGSAALSNFDVFAQAGGQYIALDKSFPVAVSGGQIAIQFSNGPANSPLINAIEILPGTSTTPPASSGSGTTTNGTTTSVPAGGDLQAALNAAMPGDTIVLQAGAVYTGSFHLPDKPGSQYITIQSSALASLPPDGSRVSPADAKNMPRVQSSYTDVFHTDTPSHHYRLIGLELAPAPGSDIDSIVVLGSGSESNDADFPHDIELQRVYIHGDPALGTKRGVAVNARNLTVRDSYISDCKRMGQDSQAIAGWNGSRYVSILNNYLEGAAENILFTADATAAQYLPADITIRGNYVRKPLSWKADDPSFAGTRWSVKNLFELKGALRVTVDGNIFENNWSESQDGFAIVAFSTEYTWGAVQHVTFTNNIVRHSGSGVNICGDSCSPPVAVTPASDFLIANNSFEDIGASTWTGAGNASRLFQVINNASGVRFQHNTAANGQNGTFLMADGSPSAGFVFTDNLIAQSVYGIVGSGMGTPITALGFYFPGSVFQGNAIIGGTAAIYPAGNFFPADLGAVGFTAPGSGDYSLSPSSPYAGKATDGTNVGVNWNTLRAATATTITGRP